jgi:hypothetical protein
MTSSYVDFEMRGLHLRAARRNTNLTDDSLQAIHNSFDLLNKRYEYQDDEGGRRRLVCNRWPV